METFSYLYMHLFTTVSLNLSYKYEALKEHNIHGFVVQ